MERFNALGRGTQLMLVGSVLLLISSFFAWQDFGDAGIITRNAWHGLGVVMGLLTIVLLAWIVARLAAVEIPIPLSGAMISGVLSFLIFAFALLTNLIDDYSTFWSYLGVAFAALIAAGAWLQIQASGGMEALKGEASSLGSSASAAAPAATATAAPTPAAPAAEVAASEVAESAETAADDTTTEAPEHDSPSNEREA